MTTRQRRWEEFLLHAEVKDAIAYAFMAPLEWETWEPMIPDGTYKLKNGGMLKVYDERTGVRYIPHEEVQKENET